MGPSVQGRDEFQCSSAIILVNHLAGYPVSIGSDRARAFVEGVIQQLTEYSGITHVLGSVYHPTPMVHWEERRASLVLFAKRL